MFLTSIFTELKDCKETPILKFHSNCIKSLEDM